MEKHCANHPESLALATCKACEKSVCLMCVCDEKEGTFCSTKCTQVFREVADWVDPGATPVPATAAPTPAHSSGSIFDPEPGTPAPAAAAEMTPPPATEPAEFEPLVTPGTKWRMIGSVCALHTDTQAVATCEACDRTLCALCVTEADNGTFCSECAAKKAPPAPLPVTAAPRPAAPAPARARARSRRSGSGLKIVAAILIVAGLAGVGFFLLNDSAAPAPNPPIAKARPPKVDPAKTDPPKVDPPKVDPAKTDPKKVDPPGWVPPRKVEPPPKPKPPGLIVNPWESVTPGAWYRVKTIRGSEESCSDFVLKAKEEGSYTLATSRGDEKTVIAPFWVRGEEKLSIDGRDWLCEIREFETPPAKRWVLVDGRNAGVVLKEEGGGGTLSVDRLWDHTVRVAGRSYDCLVVEGVRNGARYKLWYSSRAPAGTVRLETGDGATLLVDQGDDASTRPPLPK